MKKILVVILFLTGCTSIQVKELDASYSVKHICIEENPRVKVVDFVPVIEKLFNNHSIHTEVYKGERPGHCEFKLTYTARRSWDFTPYLSTAELHLYKGATQVASADYYLKGKGGFALTKWASVETKMTPVINRLLRQYQ